jgi:hypothetical protein
LIAFLLLHTFTVHQLFIKPKPLNMKALNDGIRIAVAISMFLSSCAKNEESATNVPAAIAEVHTVGPQPTPTPGSEPSNPIPLPPYDPGVRPPDQPYTAIDNPTAAYINETCLFDISKMVVGSTYHQVNNKNINIGFFSAYDAIKVQRFTNTGSPTWGWNAHWNYSPYVEKERPDVLVTGEDQTFVLALSKPCIEFGIEVSPNIQQADHLYAVDFGNFVYDSSAGYAQQRLKTPSGARLFAVKSTKPFSVVTIGFVFENGSVDYINLPDGLAIANIRYKLAP